MSRANVSIRRGMIKVKPNQKKKTRPDHEATTRQQEWLAKGAAAAVVTGASKPVIPAATSATSLSFQWMLIITVSIIGIVGGAAYFFNDGGAESSYAAISGSRSGKEKIARKPRKLSQTPAEKLTYHRTELVAPIDEGDESFGAPLGHSLTLQQSGEITPLARSSNRHSQTCIVSGTSAAEVQEELLRCPW